MKPEHRQRAILHCKACGEREFSAVVVALVIFAPGIEPLNLSPSDYIRICLGDCDARWIYVTKSATAHPISRDAAPWTQAALVFADGTGFSLKAKRREVQALA